MPGREPGIVQIQTGRWQTRKTVQPWQTWKTWETWESWRFSDSCKFSQDPDSRQLFIPFIPWLEFELCAPGIIYTEDLHIYRELYEQNSSVFVSQQVGGGDKKEMLMWVLAVKSRSRPFLNASQEIEADKRQVSDFPTTTTVNDEKRVGNIQKKIHFCVEKYIFDVEKIHLLSHCTAREGGNVCGAPA